MINCSYSNPVNISNTTTTVDYEYSSSTCEIVNSSSTGALYYNGFSYGEITISLFLFLMFMIGIFLSFWLVVIKPHIHKIHKK